MIRTRGFTLIELMIVVLIIAILVSVAYPAYTRYGFRSRRTDGQQALLTIANAQERFYGTYNKYADDLTKLGYATAYSPGGYYALALAVGDDSAQGYTATAQPMGNQRGDACGTLSIDNIGSKTPAAGNASANANGSCW